MFVTNWISTTKIQKISEITNFFRHYFLSRTEVKNIINITIFIELFKKRQQKPFILQAKNTNSMTKSHTCNTILSSIIALFTQ